MTRIVADHWQDEWLRANWDATPETVECAFGLGLITLRQYLDATDAAWRAELDRKIVDGVAETLTIDEALAVIRSRVSA